MNAKLMTVLLGLIAIAAFAAHVKWATPLGFHDA